MFDLNVPKIKIPKIKNPSLRRALPRKRDLARATNIFNKPIREPVPAKLGRRFLQKQKINANILIVLLKKKEI